ncbi:Hypothetical protein FKW44_012856, partial [Caligus rogercresseyi]
GETAPIGSIIKAIENPLFDPSLYWFRYRIITNTLTTSYTHGKLVNYGSCFFCKKYKETAYHFLAECEAIRDVREK